LGSALRRLPHPSWCSSLIAVAQVSALVVAQDTFQELVF
jgi:hypothetical protein